MSDLKVELEEARGEPESGVEFGQTPVRKRGRPWLYAAPAVAVVGITAAIFWWRLETMQNAPPTEPVPLTTYLGDQDDADFSPDGSQVVFAWNGETRGKYHIYVKPMASADYLQLTKGDPEEICPKWSPDGQWIAFQRYGSAGQHTFMMSPIGGSERRLHDGACTGLSWSSDSRALACASPSGLILISLETENVRQLTSVENGQFDAFPSFSPDSRQLLFIKRDPTRRLRSISARAESGSVPPSKASPDYIRTCVGDVSRRFSLGGTRP